MPKEKNKYRIVIWDTETRLEKTNERGEQRHKVNYLSARITCTECADSEDGVDLDCGICMTEDGNYERMKDWYVI